MSGPRNPNPAGALDRWGWLLLAATYLATRLPFVYWNGFPDSDQEQMALGTVEAVVSGSFFGGHRLYGTHFTVGYYALLFAFRPLLATHPHAIAPLMNLLGVGFGLVAQLAFWGILRTLWGTSAALAGSLLLLFLPGWCELNTFGHPTPMALALFLAALLAFLRALPPGESLRISSLVLATVLTACAASIRADVLLAGAAFPACAWARGRRAPQALALGSIAVLVGVAAWWAMQTAWVPAATTQAGPGLLRKVADVFRPSPAILRKELAVWGLGMGPVVLASGIWGWIACAVRKRGSALGIAASVTAPELAWWLQVEGQFRHFLAASVFGLVPFAAACSRWRLRTVLGVTLVIQVVNLAACAALYEPVVRFYPWTYPAAPGERRWSTRVPIGDWFSSHRAAQTAVNREERLARWLATVNRPRILVVTPIPFRFELEIVARGEPYRYSFLREAGADWIRLETPERVYLFLQGDPEPTREALRRAVAERRLEGFSVYLPANASPQGPLPLPPGAKILTPPRAGP